MGNFKTVKDCNKWLGEIRMGTTWDAEMEALLEQECGDVLPPPLTTMDQCYFVRLQILIVNALICY